MEVLLCGGVCEVTCRHHTEYASVPCDLHPSVTIMSRESSATSENNANDDVLLPERAAEGVQPRLIHGPPLNPQLPDFKLHRACERVPATDAVTLWNIPPSLIVCLC